MRSLFVAICLFSPVLHALEAPPPIEFADKWKAVGAELAFPDVRWEWGAGAPAGTLSWPVAFQLNGTDKLGPFLDGRFVTAFAEPQWKPGKAYRFAAGVRWTQLFEPFGFVVEGGGLLATDGSGGFVGGGPCVGFEIVQLALVYRRSFTVAGQRNDVALDLVLPFSSALDAF